MTGVLHPDDRAHVEQVVAELRALRRASGDHMDVIGARIGRDGEAIRLAENGPNRRAGTLQALAYAMGRRLTFHLDGLPAVDDPAVATLTLSARQARDFRRRHAFERAALGAQLAAVRRHLGFTQQQMLHAAGRGGSFISDLEQGKAGDSVLASYQRYARALGGMLRLRLAVDGVTDEVRLRALLDELSEHASVTAVRCRAVTPAGAVEGVSSHDAQLAVAEFGGRVEHQEVWLLPTGHEVLGPWLPHPALAVEVAARPVIDGT